MRFSGNLLRDVFSKRLRNLLLRSVPVTRHRVPALAVTVETAAAAVRQQLSRLHAGSFVGKGAQLAQWAGQRIACVDDGTVLIGYKDQVSLIVG